MNVSALATEHFDRVDSSEVKCGTNSICNSLIDALGSRVTRFSFAAEADSLLKTQRLLFCAAL